MSATPDLTVEATAAVAFVPQNTFEATVTVTAADLTFRAYVDVPEPQRLGIALVDVPYG